MALHAIVTVVPDGPTLAALRDMVAQCRRLGVPEDAPLRGGGHIRIGDGPALNERFASTLSGLASWVGAHDRMPGKTMVANTEALAIDTVSPVIAEAPCTDHRGGVHLVGWLHPGCWDHAHRAPRVDAAGVTLVGGQRIEVPHAPQACAGRACWVHAPSDHHMRGWIQSFSERHGVERMCRHHIAHPDPDADRPSRPHMCDGCCKPSPERD